jgi:hypothetical protein
LNKEPDMSWATKLLILVSSATLIGTSPICSPLQARGEVKTLFKADEAIETLTVKIDIGKGGEALDEPVALELGLGFPLWLHPLGRKAGEIVPFGAIPQQTTAGTDLAAGSSATFTFSINGEPGQDELKTTPQLLAGVRVSDIARVGLASEGKSNWVLAGFEIQINGKVFASQSGLNQSVKAVQRAALTKQQELMKELVPILQRAGNGRPASDQGASPGPAGKLGAEALDAKAYSPADREKITNFLCERQRMEGLLRGVYPWFEDAGFRSPWRASANVKTAKVTVETAAHAGADTRNYVYSRGGGHKYWLGSPEVPLSAEKGPQTFTLDLLAGPLMAADLRGWAVGMLAHPHRQGTTPDRWHPHRLMIEIDGQIIYDSEESALDRLSLEAIRLIPPAHWTRDGTLVRNTPVAREAFVWEAGKGAGLDLSHGGALALPGKDDPASPKPETGPGGCSASQRIGSRCSGTRRRGPDLPSRL